MKIVSTIEARMTSSRLPGKPLLDAAGRPMLEHLVRRLKAVPSIDDIVLATTVNAADQPLVDLAAELGIKAFRGSEDDVMLRVIEAARSADADVIVEITGDCPVIDPEIIEQAIRTFKAHQADYVSNAVIRSYPDGMDVQVFALDTLIKSATMTDSALDHEHVTLHIRDNPEIFSQIHLVAPPEQTWPELGLTLDEKSDYVLLKKVIEHFDASNPLFSCRDAVRYLRANPDLLDLNRDVVRKGNT
ncbi:cytidylyltransferase domain-containing protein [Rhizobium leguminosarum]|uniref:cytidylyltransferase domain-containing protein n=1 Tax=Rhizobium leguminosarum TaxID=384 RepID=UPI0010317867|nr:glycosyltransferase family protein [Rhizobium leguminosarum]TAU87481.1 spore coat biosynthesis protein F [Rhizobium leguminosarum]TAV52013.1 spore coat biosynthesis protein F [Rhizobium leguminosarum]